MIDATGRRRTVRLAATVIAGAAIVASACGTDDTARPAAGTAAPSGNATTPSSGDTAPSTGNGASGTAHRGPTAVGDLDAVEVALEPFAELDEPVALVQPGGGELLWVAERPGRVVRLDPRTGELVDTIIDITASTSADGERGLLGLAVDDEAVYVDYTDRSGDTHVDAFVLAGDGLPTTDAVPLLSQEQPFANHNGGGLAIGPDGHLYVSLGDGGSGGDPLGSGQDPGTWLGSILRIDPTPSGPEPYVVPPDNPFADDGGRAEIFLIGVRNAWRFSFDSLTGDLWVADVGQDAFEELNLLPAATGGGRGANLGWNLREGLHEFAGDAPAGHVEPVFEYDHGSGCSITGGFVYRGTAIPELDGAHVFGDFCTSRLWAVALVDGTVVFRDLDVDVPGGALAGFGEDAAGELYVLSLAGPISRIVPG
ncbi:MAG: PQQ-dependent sugar dehydrogenase [Acidimicrobiales bacterium]